MYVRCAVCYLLFRLVHTLFNFQIPNRRALNRWRRKRRRKKNTRLIFSFFFFFSFGNSSFVNRAVVELLCKQKIPYIKLKPWARERDRRQRRGRDHTMTTTNRIRCVSRKEAMKIKWKKIDIRFFSSLSLAGWLVRSYLSYIERYRRRR